MQLFEMKQQQTYALNKAESFVKAAEGAHREMTETEAREYETCMTAVNALTPRIKAIEGNNTLGRAFAEGRLLPGVAGAGTSEGAPKVLGADYLSAFQSWMLTGGEQTNAALYEGVGSQGGYAVPITVDGQIVPLAPSETGLRKIATVLPTTNDVRIPRQTAFSTATGKAESGASANSFTETGPTLDQITLGANMAGAYVKVSFELAQDYPAFQAFAVSDLLNAQQQVEEGWYITGTGIGQAQGLIGNVGAGITAGPDTAGNLVSIDATLDVLGSLNATYHENASFLMSRLTSIIIRKAQRQANLFEPVWTRSNGQDYLHGYPVQYSAAMPTAARGSSPVLFGDFAKGYVIGDRGGSGISVKLLDQPFALAGQIALLAFRRTDGRVRRAEAIQSLNIAAS